MQIICEGWGCNKILWELLWGRSVTVTLESEEYSSIAGSVQRPTSPLTLINLFSQARIRAKVIVMYILLLDRDVAEVPGQEKIKREKK